MNLQVAVNQISTLFIIMFIGLIAKKVKLIDKASEKSMSNILLYIALPALMLSSANISYDSNTLPNMMQVFYVTLIQYFAVIVFANITAKLLKFKFPLSGAYINLLTFANVGFMGFPIANAFFGPAGLLYATVANLLFNIFQWTYAILVISKKGRIDIKRLFNIGTISAVLTITIFLLHIKLPFIIQNALDLTGKMTTPISMILIGSFIADLDSIKSFFDWRVITIAVFKLLLIPFTVAIALNALGVNHTVISICVLMAAMPSASTNAILAKQFDAEAAFTSVAVFVTTLLFLLSLPLVIFVLTNFILK
ncbi:AEC family transporter [Lutispora sp.]|nr:AEC family transporter [Lutispora sp.]MEA4963109.1 AEC family transporter [Lutispora sp.]